MQFLFSDYVLDAGRRELWRGGERLAIEPQVFDLLVYLVENRERVASKDDMLAAVWGGRIVSESTLTSRINAVRKAVGDTGKDQKLIRTVARKGIRFVGTVTVSEKTAAVDAQAPQTRVSVLNNLPLRRLSFLGREQDVSKVAELLETTNLVTLTGAGGIGKTSMALKIAAGVLDRFSDGVWLVELAPIADPQLVTGAVADVFGLREEGSRPLLATLLEFLRNRRLMIVLDNCEHVTEACARFADAALRVSGGTRILATSREPLGIDGELTWHVPPLPAPDPHEQTAGTDLMRFPAVRLFVERAKLARVSFEFTNENAPLVSQVCWRLDGIPLAIELAASRVKAMQIEQIVDRLDDRFRLLTGGSRTAMPHQQTLRSTIDWSYSLLSEPERELLCRLSVFSGGWTLEAAEAVCGGDGRLDVLDTLAHLVDRSLVILDEGVAEPRYRMLETIRQYSQEKLQETEEVSALCSRHLEYFIKVAESIEPYFYHPDQTKWYARADRELDNIRGALEWSLKSGAIEQGLRLVNALHRYWVARVHWLEATGWLERLLAAGADRPTPLRAKSMFVAGHIGKYYDLATAERLGRESLRIAQSLGYQQGAANALWLLGWCLSSRLDGSADRYFQESIELACSIDYAWAAVHAYTWYGVYKIAVGEFEAAKPLLEAAKIEANRIGGDATLLGRCDENLGLIALLQADYPTAKQYLDQSLALVRGAGNINSTASTLWTQGRLALRKGDHDGATSYFIESLKLFQLYSTSVWVTRALAFLAITFLADDHANLAARIAGALDGTDERSRLVRTHLGSHAAISEYEHALAEIRRALPAAEFSAAWAAGRAMTREQAIALVLKR